MKPKRTPITTLKFCARPHPEHASVGCVLESGHPGPHVAYKPVPAGTSGGIGGESMPRTELKWDD